MTDWGLRLRRPVLGRRHSSNRYGQDQDRTVNVPVQLQTYRRCELGEWECDSEMVKFPLAFVFALWSHALQAGGEISSRSSGCSRPAEKRMKPSLSRVGAGFREL